MVPGLATTTSTRNIRYLLYSLWWTTLTITAAILAASAVL